MSRRGRGIRSTDEYGDRMAATWTSPVTRLVSAKELLDANQENNEGTPSSILKLKVNARKHFDGIALSITNEKWKGRWKSMCVLQSGDVLDGLEEDEEEHKRRDRELELRAEQWRAAPSFLREECNMIGLGRQPPGLRDDVAPLC